VDIWANYLPVHSVDHFANPPNPSATVQATTPVSTPSSLMGDGADDSSVGSSAMNDQDFEDEVDGMSIWC